MGGQYTLFQEQNFNTIACALISPKTIVQLSLLIVVSILFHNNGIIEENVLTRYPSKGDFRANLACGGSYKVTKLKAKYLPLLKEDFLHNYLQLCMNEKAT